jgi:hypothetical protein
VRSRYCCTLTWAVGVFCEAKATEGAAAASKRENTRADFITTFFPFNDATAAAPDSFSISRSSTDSTDFETRRMTQWMWRAHPPLQSVDPQVPPRTLNDIDDKINNHAVPPIGISHVRAPFAPKSLSSPGEGKILDKSLKINQIYLFESWQFSFCPHAKIDTEAIAKPRHARGLLSLTRQRKVRKINTLRFNPMLTCL